jgi:hypothetical protein
MDIDTLIHVIVDDHDHVEDMAPAAVAAAIHAGTSQSREAANEHRHERRQYLTRPELVPCPRTALAWAHLYASQSDRAFITTMGFDVDTFHYILIDGGFENMWNSTPIPRYDTSSTGEPRLGARSLDAAGALGLVLHHYGLAMNNTGLQLIFALIPTTVVRYLAFAKTLLLAVLQRIPEGKIRWWGDVEEFEQDEELIRARHSRLGGVVGSMDGLSLPVHASGDPEIENAAYNAWKSDHRVNNVLVFSPQGAFLLY